MILRKLRRTHADYDAVTLQRHADLVAGGVEFHKRIDRYLLKHDVEPTKVYKLRCDQAYYLGYCAPIVQYFASWLFSSPLVFKSDPEIVDDWYSKFKEDVDALGTDLDQFMRHAFIQACIGRSAFWRVEFPEPVAEPRNKAEWQKQGLGSARLCYLPSKCLINWRRDEYGQFLWAMEHDCREELIEPTDDEPTVTETWTLWRADGSVQRWQSVHLKSRQPAPDDQIGEISAPSNPTGAMPIMEMKLPVELWVMNLLSDGQLEHFRKSNALSWSIDRTCYAMPVFNLKDTKKPPKMGAGYYLMLGIDEQLTWPAPPPAPFATIQEYNAKLKDELHRVTHMMAMGTENNAAALGRSAESKSADNSATEIVLGAMGRYVREATEKTYDLVSRGRGEKIEWHVGGMDNYRLPDVGTITANAIAIESLNIPSATLRRNLLTQVGLAALVDADEPTKDAIRKEIEAGVTDEDVAIMHQATVAGAQGTIKQAKLIGKDPASGEENAA